MGGTEGRSTQQHGGSAAAAAASRPSAGGVVRAAGWAAGTLSDGSPLARKRDFMARLRTLIPAVVQALRKTQQRDKRNFDANLGPRNVKVKIGDYVYTTTHHRDNKLASIAIGPFVVVDADDSTFVIDIDGTEKRVSSDHTTPAPRPACSHDKKPHPLLDGFDKPRPDPKIHDKYVIEKLLAYRKEGDSYEFKVRWYDYYPKDDTWEPVENLPRSMVIRHLRSKKVELPEFTWKRTHVASQPATVALADATRLNTPSHWTPQIQAVHVDPWGVVHTNVRWDNAERSITEQVPVHYLKSTLPTACRHFAYSYWEQTATNLSLVQKYGPLYMGGVPHTSIFCPKGTPVLSPPTQKLDGLVNDLESKSREALLLAPQWEDAGWSYGRCRP